MSASVPDKQDLMPEEILAIVLVNDPYERYDLLDWAKVTADRQLKALDAAGFDVVARRGTRVGWASP